MKDEPAKVEDDCLDPVSFASTAQLQYELAKRAEVLVIASRANIKDKNEVTYTVKGNITEINELLLIVARAAKREARKHADPRRNHTSSGEDEAH